MVEDSIPKALLKETKDIGKKNGQVLHVMEEEGEMFPSPPLQPTDHILGPPHSCPIRRQTFYGLEQY